LHIEMALIDPACQAHFKTVPPDRCLKMQLLVMQRGTPQSRDVILNAQQD
jgi:hypothetical protein